MPGHAGLSQLVNGASLPSLDQKRDEEEEIEIFPRIRTQQHFQRAKKAIRPSLPIEAASYSCFKYTTANLWIFFLAIGKDFDMMSLIVMTPKGLELGEIIVNCVIGYSIASFIMFLGYFLYKNKQFRESSENRKTKLGDAYTGPAYGDRGEVWDFLEWYYIIPFFGVMGIITYYNNSRPEDINNSELASFKMFQKLPGKEDTDFDREKDSLFIRKMEQYKKGSKSRRAAILTTLVNISYGYFITVNVPQLIIITFMCLQDLEKTLADFFVIFSLVQAVLSLISVFGSCCCRGCLEQSQEILMVARELTLKEEHDRKYRKELLDYYITFKEEIKPLYTPLKEFEKATLESLKKRQLSNKYLSSAGKDEKNKKNRKNPYKADKHLTNYDCFASIFKQLILQRNNRHLNRILGEVRTYRKNHEDKKENAQNIWEETSIYKLTEDLSNDSFDSVAILRAALSLVNLEDLKNGNLDEVKLEGQILDWFLQGGDICQVPLLQGGDYLPGKNKPEARKIGDLYKVATSIMKLYSRLDDIVNTVEREIRVHKSVVSGPALKPVQSQRADMILRAQGRATGSIGPNTM